jgi:hypothetical protein
VEEDLENTLFQITEAIQLHDFRRRSFIAYPLFSLFPPVQILLAEYSK